MIEEALIAFVLIFISTYAIYAIGRRSAPKTAISENEQAAYACGEKVHLPQHKNQRFPIQVSNLLRSLRLHPSLSLPSRLLRSRKQTRFS